MGLTVHRWFVAVAATFVVATCLGAAEPLVSVQTNWDDVVLHLMTTERKGNVLTVKWTLKNEGEETQKYHFVFTGRDPCYVLDEENGTKYYALTDKEGNAIASANEFIAHQRHGVRGELGAGKSRSFWMKMPAPPPEVEEIAVFLTETEPLEGIRITTRE